MIVVPSLSRGTVVVDAGANTSCGWSRVHVRDAVCPAADDGGDERAEHSDAGGERDASVAANAHLSTT